MKSIASFAVANLLLSASLLDAQIIARFTGGGSHQSPVTDKVDAYLGMSGNGWMGPWALREYGTGSLQSLAVEDPSGLWSTPRLRLAASNHGTGTGFGVYRDYTSYRSVDLSQTIQLSFQVSFDDLGSFLDTSGNEIFIGQNNSTSMNRSSGSGWFIQAFGGTDPTKSVSHVGSGYNTARQGQWNLGNGGNFVPTGVLLETGTLYSFVVTIHPESFNYTVTLKHGEETFESAILTFYSEQPLKRLLIGQQYAAGEGLDFSIGNIAVIPESSTSSLTLLGLAMASLFYYRARKAQPSP